MPGQERQKRSVPHDVFEARIMCCELAVWQEIAQRVVMKALEGLLIDYEGPSKEVKEKERADEWVKETGKQWDAINEQFAVWKKLERSYTEKLLQSELQAIEWGICKAKDAALISVFERDHPALNADSDYHDKEEDWEDVGASTKD